MQCPLCASMSVQDVVVSKGRSIPVCSTPTCLYVGEEVSVPVPSSAPDHTAQSSDVIASSCTSPPSSSDWQSVDLQSITLPSNIPSFSADNDISNIDLQFIEEFFECKSDEKSISLEYVSVPIPARVSEAHPQVAVLVHLLLTTASFDLPLMHAKRLRELHSKLLSMEIDSKLRAGIYRQWVSCVAQLSTNLKCSPGELSKLVEESPYIPSTSSWWAAPLFLMLRHLIHSHPEMHTKFDFSCPVEACCDHCTRSWVPVKASSSPYAWLWIHKPSWPNLFTLESRDCHFQQVCPVCQVCPRIFRLTWEKIPEALILHFSEGLPTFVTLDDHCCLPSAQLYCTVLLCENLGDQQTWMWIRHRALADYWARVDLTGCTRAPAPNDEVSTTHTFVGTRAADIQADLSSVRFALLERRADVCLQRRSYLMPRSGAAGPSVSSPASAPPCLYSQFSVLDGIAPPTTFSCSSSVFGEGELQHSPSGAPLSISASCTSVKKESKCRRYASSSGTVASSSSASTALPKGNDYLMRRFISSQFTQQWRQRLTIEKQQEESKDTKTKRRSRTLLERMILQKKAALHLL